MHSHYVLRVNRHLYTMVSEAPTRYRRFWATTHRWLLKNTFWRNLHWFNSLISNLVTSHLLTRTMSMRSLRENTHMLSIHTKNMVWIYDGHSLGTRDGTRHPFPAQNFYSHQKRVLFTPTQLLTTLIFFKDFCRNEKPELCSSQLYQWEGLDRANKNLFWTPYPREPRLHVTPHYM